MKKFTRNRKEKKQLERPQSQPQSGQEATISVIVAVSFLIQMRRNNESACNSLSSRSVKEKGIPKG